MSNKNDPIDCFNHSECIYIKCGMYDDTVSICGIERLKTITIKEAAKPSQVQAAQGRVQASKEPDMEKLIQEEMAKAAGLLTREAAEYMVKQSLANKQKISKANEKPFTNCKDVINGMKGFKVHGRLLDDPISKEVNTIKGPKSIIVTRIDDGTSPLRITFWNPEKVPILKAGDEITIEGLLGSNPYDGVPQAGGGPYIKITFEKV